MKKKQKVKKEDEVQKCTANVKLVCLASKCERQLIISSYHKKKNCIVCKFVHDIVSA